MIDTNIVDKDHFECLGPDELEVKKSRALSLEESPETQENNIMGNAYLLERTVCTAAFGL